MNKNPTATIIGAGIGGITTAVFLARQGYSVDIYEKNSFPGGRCGLMERDGHRFDIGATMMLMPGIYREVFSSLGLKLEETIDLMPLNNLYTIFFDDGTKLEFTSDEKRMRSQLEKIEKGSSVKEREYVKTGYRLYRESYDKLIGRNFLKFFDFFTLPNALLLIRLKTYIRHHRYAAKFFRNRHLQMAYTFQNIYVGQNPFHSPALFSMIPAVELVEGSLFPKGGMSGITGTLAGIAAKNGVRFHYNSQVKAINVDGRKVAGITLNDGTQKFSDIVVANADLPYVYRELLPSGLKSRRIDRMNYSCSALVLHWALDKRYPQLDHHNVFLSDDFREGLDMIFKKKSMGDDPCFYIHAPARSDQSAAPGDGDSLSIAVGVGHLDNNHPQDWENIRVRARDAVIRKLKMHGITDIEEHIKFEIAMPPLLWEEKFNITHGSVFGSLGHNIFQMGYFRPHNRDSRYRNLYFTGGSTHPGNGIPFVLLSARLVSDRIINDMKTV